MKTYTLNGTFDMALSDQKQSVCPKFNAKMLLPGTVSEQKLSAKTTEKSTGYLTDPYAFEGKLWLKKTINLQNYSKDNWYTLVLERTRQSSVWIDGVLVGTCNSFCTAQRFDITAFAKAKFELCLCICNANYVTSGGHMTSKDTQTNWLGVLGDVYIIEEKNIKIDKFCLAVKNAQSEAPVLQVSFDAQFLQGKSECAKLRACGKQKTFDLLQGKNFVQLELGNVEKWSEWSPVLHECTLELGEQTYRKNFGVRAFCAGSQNDGTYGFFINGRITFLRGKHDGMIFPLTAYAPMDVASWRAVLQKAKDYGINHYRFHTCCPPEACFVAADELGIYLEPELPFWGTIHAQNDEGFNKAEQDFLIEEGFRIINEFSHHPSFVLFSLGNELWGSRERLSSIIKGFKNVNSSILYTSGSNNFQFYPQEIPEEDFFVGVRLDKDSLLRGSYAQCDAPLGFVQTDAPNTTHNYDAFFAQNNFDANANNATEIEIQFGTGVKKVSANGANARYVPKKPCVTHEIGQYYIYPDFAEIDEYTGVLKAENFKIFKERLCQKGLGHLASLYTKASGKLASSCYKLELEAARKSRNIAGFQLLDLQDFSGQGTATVGILNAFMREKGIVSQKDWLMSNAETIIMASLERFVFAKDETLHIGITASHFDATDLEQCSVCARLGAWQKTFACTTLKNGITDIAQIDVPCKSAIDANGNVRAPLELKLFAKDASLIAENFYNLYFFAKDTPCAHLAEALSQDKSCIIDGVLFTSKRQDADAFIAGTFAGADGCADKTATTATGAHVDGCADANCTAQTGAKRRAVLFAKSANGIEGTYCTDFWNYPMFRSISASMHKKEPVGTLGLLIDNTHPALKYFLADDFSTPQWFNLVQNSNAAILDGTNIEPIVRVIDNVERNHNLGILYKENDSLLVCSVDAHVFAKHFETQHLLCGIVEYATSQDFFS